MMDPDIDYAQVERSWFHQPWILPLHEPLRRDPWVVPLTEWEQHVAVPSPDEMIQVASKPMTTRNRSRGTGSNEF